MKAMAGWVSALMFVFVKPVFASVAVLMEEPYGHLGSFEPAGHAEIYLDHVCAESPVRLRSCKPGELGVVLGRHRVGGFDWIAIPLIPYLYAVDNAREVPATVDRARVAALRDAYRRGHLEALAPDGPDGSTPHGDWIVLVGSTFDRTIHGFQIESTPEQDARLIALFNNMPNHTRYDAFFRNCADFTRMVVDLYLPGAVKRSFLADLGLTTPKHVVRSLLKYAHKHPEVGLSTFVILQVPGSLPRSHEARGIAEILVRSKKYLIPLTVLNPAVTGALVAAYLADGRLTLPKDAKVFRADDIETGMAPVESAASSGAAR